VPVATAASLACGLTIIAVDRWIAASLLTGRPRQPVILIPKLALAVLLAALVSVPFLLQVFQHEINGQVAVIKHQRLTAFLTAQQISPTGQLVTAWSNDVNNLQTLKNLSGKPVNPNSDSELRTLTEQRAAAVTAEERYFAQWQCQLYGGSGCSRPTGNGPLAQTSLNSYEQSVHQVAQLNEKITARSNQLSGTHAASGNINYDQVVAGLNSALQKLRSAVTDQERQKSTFTARNNADDGLAISLEALLRVSVTNPRLSAACSLALALFLIAFCLPALIKLTQPTGNYEIILSVAASRAKEQTDGSRPGRIRFWRQSGVPNGGFSMSGTASREVRGHAFISYVREDSRHVDWLADKLKAAGIPVWRDTADLWPGEDWRAKIRQAITDDALVFIACFSKRSLARTKTYQNEELILAIEQLRSRRPEDPWLIPVRFSDCEIPDRDIGAGRTLKSLQRTDLFGKRADEGAARVVATVLRMLQRPRGLP
jgi:uncharacterized protein YukE